MDTAQHVGKEASGASPEVHITHRRNGGNSGVCQDQGKQGSCKRGAASIPDDVKVDESALAASCGGATCTVQAPPPGDNDEDVPEGYAPPPLPFLCTVLVKAGSGHVMGVAKASAFAVLMFTLSATQEWMAQNVLKDLPLPWVVATLHFGAGILWVFPAWAIGLRQTPCLNDFQKKRVAPLAFLHAAGYLCSLGVLHTGSSAVLHVFQGLEPAAVSFMSWLVAEKAEHFVSRLALLPLMAGVVITFQEGLARSWFASTVGVCAALLSGARTTFSHKVMVADAVAFKGQLCSVIFVSACLILLPFAVVMEGAQVVRRWERAAMEIGGSALIMKFIKGGTFLYMWSECFFGLQEEAGPSVAAVVVAVRPVAVYAFRAMFLEAAWTMGRGAGTALTAAGAALFLVAKHKYTLRPRRTKQ